MNYNKKTVYDVDVKGKKVLLRCDFNVPQDKKTGEIMKKPVIKFKVGWAVPIKSSAEGKLVSDSHLKRDEDGEWRLINNQLSIEELMGGEDG